MLEFEEVRLVVEETRCANGEMVEWTGGKNGPTSGPIPGALDLRLGCQGKKAKVMLKARKEKKL